MTSKVENLPSCSKSSNQNSLLSDYKINGKIAPLNGSKNLQGPVKSENFEFEIPPEAPVFYPTEEEFKDPLAYINKIRPAAENTGICKIKPPANWQPPFAVDVDKLRFTPRIQRLNELEAKTRVKLNFLDQIAKFWELQGSALRIPMVEKRALDLYTLHRLVQKEGGSDNVSKERKWSKIAGLMGYPVGKGIGTILKTHYERLLYPYDVFKNGKSVSISVENSPPDSDRDYKPHGIVGRMNVKPPNDKHFRRSKRYEDDPDSKPEINGKDTIIKLEPVDGNESDQNKELRRLQFYGAGPKMAGYNIKNEEKMKSKNSNCDDPLAKYVCQHCSRGDVEESMLLCDGCDDSYHTFCLMPPLTEIPKGDWRCPSCVAVEVSKPTEAFGFEQAQREYSLQQFGEMADQFKSDYFNSPVHLVRTCDVEKEFWRIVSSIDEDVTVEYGADLHTMDHGSGFPTSTSINLMPGDIEYADSQWNLNNLPVLEGSVLGYINADISGMKVPWMYVGMCFSTFCWHNEDHWSYSINYLHWGEPKTWYGVPGTKAIAFEETMKSAAPELFHSQPDLLHQLVTIMNPNILMSAGVPVFRTDQNAGEFVVTFPRAYHAGFNQGYNFAEAVNFAPADWLKMGRECIQHYSILRRFCVFSHDELVCKMALEPERLTPLIAASLYEDMLHMVDSEKRMRKHLLDWGVTNALRESFELYPDDERQCEVCKTTCFLSAITCSCSGKTIVCLRHFNDLCRCPPSAHTLRYRYTLDELPKMLNKLKIKAEAFDLWLSNVRDSLDPCVPSTLSLYELKGLLEEAEDKNFPKSDLIATLSSAIEDAEKCASVIRQLDSTMARTRTRNSTDRKYHLNLEELNLFIGEIESLACILEEAQIVRDLLEESNKFEANSQIFMNISLSDCRCDELERCLEHGEAICIELPSLNIMRERLRQVKWLVEVKETREKSDPLNKDVINRFIESGEMLNSDVLIEKEVDNFRNLLSLADNWEVRAQAILSKPHPELITEIELLLAEAKQINAFLPSEKFLIETVDCVKQWSKQLDEINAAEFYPYINVVESLIQKGRTIPLPIPHVSDLEQYVIAGYNWRDKTSRIFLRKNSMLNLLDALSPRHPSTLNNVKVRRKPSEDVVPFMVTNEMEPVDVVNTFKEAEERELEGIRQLRNVNSAKSFNVESDSKFCVCQRNAFGVMMRCELCRDWFHSTCVTLPKIANIKVKGNFTATSLRLGFKDSKFLCPSCFRTKRPRLETILSLLVSLQKLSVRIPEGEALQCLTERAMTWQDRVKQLLQTTDIEKAMAKLSILTQKYSEAAARQKTEKIISSELKKAASNPDLKQHLHDIASWSGITTDSADASMEVGECTSTVSSSQDDTIDEHAYSLHIPNIDCRDYILKLPNPTQQLLEDILLEGDLLEVSLDETLQLWKLVQVSRDPEKEPVMMDFSSPSKASILKKTRKRRLEEIDVRKLKQFKNDGVKKLTKRKTKNSKDSTRKQRSDLNNSRRSQEQSSSDDEVEEKCASVNCLQPSSDEVDWVQCDGGCEQWFHMACVGLSAQEINEDEDYICMTCSRSSSAFENLQQSPESQLSDNPQSPDSTQPLSMLKEV